MPPFLLRFHADILDWVGGRMWLPRVFVLLFIAYIGYQQLLHPMDWNLIAGVNLPIHELGHVITRPFGEFICVAGGTLTQLAFPLIAIGMFLRQRDYFGISFALAWLSTNMIGVGIYMADANVLALDLVSVGGGDGEIIHDWHYLFGKMGLLSASGGLGKLMGVCGHLTMIAALAFGAWIIFEMYRNPTPKPRTLM